MESASSKRFYWSIPVGGRLNISHFIPAIEIGKLLDTGANVTIFVGDLHSQLLNDKGQALDARCEFYRKVLVMIVSKVSANSTNLTVKLGSELESDKDYMLDLYLVAGSTQIDKASDASQNVVKPTKHPSLGSLVYPLVRSVDEKYVKADGQVIHENERKIVEFADGVSAKIKHQAKARVFYCPLSGLSAKKTTVINEEDDYIDVLDTPKQVKKKLSKAFCEPGNTQENGVLPILKSILFPIFKKFDIKRPEEYGGDANYSTYDQVEQDYREEKLHPGDLKKGVESKVNELLIDIQKFYESSEDFQNIASTAFPTKKDKKPTQIVPLRGPCSIEQLSLDSQKSVLSKSEKLELITRRLQEVLQKDALDSIVESRNLRIYWGTATTGRPHLAYFVPMSKIADFLRADCEVTILLADLHGYLDSQKAPWDLLDARTRYYQKIIISMLKSINVPIDRLKFVRGTEFELSRDFSKDLFRLISQTTLHDAKKAGAEVVKQMSDPLIGSLLYPLLQALDEEYLNCDAQFGGVDQRKIFIYAEKYLPQIGYSKRIHLMNPMVPGLTGGKMSSSELESKIDLLDDAKVVERKIERAACPRDSIADNGVLAFIEHVIWPLFGKLTVESQQKDYENHEKLVVDFVSGALSEMDLKSLTVTYINKLLDPIRKEFDSDELRALTKSAYP